MKVGLRSVFRRAERKLRRINKAQWEKLRFQLVRKGRLFPRISTPMVPDEKYIWRKFLDHDPRFVIACDKLASKTYLRRHTPEMPAADIIWQGLSVEDIPTSLLHPGMVLKFNAGSGTNFIIDEDTDLEHLIEVARVWMGRNYGWDKAEWGYLPVRKRLFLEKRLFSGARPSEIKVYVQGGSADQIVMIYNDTGTKTAAVWERHEASWNLAKRRAAVSPILDQRELPEVAYTALDHAERIGIGFDHMRIDYFTDLSAVVFGEFTPYNLSGRFAGLGYREDSVLNRNWDLRKSWFLNTPQHGWKDEYSDALRQFLNEHSDAPVQIDPRDFQVLYDDYAPT